MKKKLQILAIILLVFLSIGVVIWHNSLTKEVSEIKSNAFKEEYESFNDEYKEVSIPENNPMYYASEEEILELLDGTGVIFFGSSTDNIARTLTEVLISAAKKTGTLKIYYKDIEEEKEVSTIDEEGNIIVEKEGTLFYNTIKERLSDFEKTDEIETPCVIFIKDGKVLYVHTKTLENIEDEVNLTEEETLELKNILVSKMLETLSSACDSAC